MTHQTHTSTFINPMLGLILGLGSAGGCYTAADTIGQAQLAEVCPPDHCGGNASTFNDLPFGELHLLPGKNTGLANQRELYISDFIAPDGATDVVLNARQGRYTAANASETLTGSDLIGATLIISSNASTEVIEVEITDYRNELSWTENAFGIDQYMLKKKVDTDGDGVADAYEPVCSAAMDLGDQAAWTVVVSKERYSFRDIEVTASGHLAAGWFNIACVGHALAKVKLIGYDPSPPPNSPYVTTPNQRQAALKMLAGDYCGTGTVHTKDGTALYWQNPAGWSHNNPPEDRQREALWSPDGALCLDVPRLGPGYLDKIHAKCATVGKTMVPCSDNSKHYGWETSLPVSE